MGSVLRGLTSVARVAFACVAPNDSAEARRWLADLSVAPVVHRPRQPPGALRRWGERLALLARGTNLVCWPEEQRFFDRHFADVRPDAVWVETPYLVRYALAWRAPVIVDYWGTSQGAERVYRQARGWRRLADGLRWRAARAGERRYAPRLPHIVAVSELDAAYFRALAPRSRLWPIPIALPTPDPAPATSAIVEDPHTIVFTGDLSFHPNRDAVRYFVREIFPAILAARPDTRVRIAGRAPAPDVRALHAPPTVEIIGEAPDLTPLIAGAALYALPMRLGSGLRTKLLEVFPLAKPIVTTAIGLEGYALRHEEHCLVADTPRAFAQACLRLLADAGERRRLGEAARALALRMYAQEAVTRQLEEVVRTACGRERATQH